MRFYVGVTDNNWFRRLAELDPDEDRPSADFLAWHNESVYAG